MYYNLAKEPDHDQVIRRPEQVSNWASSRRDNEEIIKQGNAWETSPTVHKNNQPVPKPRRKGSKRKKQASHMKEIYFSTQDQSSQDVPEFLKKAKIQRKQLADTRTSHQTDLKAIEQRIANSRARLLDLHSEFLSHIPPLTRYQTRLLSVKKDLSRLVRLKMEHAGEVHASLTRFDSQRMSLMEKMTKPQWNKQHCFYMLALERFRENKQVKQIIDFAEVMSGNIAITAVANHSMQQHKQALACYQKLVVHRSLLEKKHSVVTKKLHVCSCRRADNERLLWMMKKKTSSRKVKEKMRKTEKILSADNIQTSESVPTPEDFSLNFKKRVSANTDTIEEESGEDETSFWQNVDVKEFITYVDEFLSEIAEEFALATRKVDATTHKNLLEFQHNHKSLDELYYVSQHSDDSRPGSSCGSSYGLSSPVATTPDPKKGECFLTPTSTSPGSSCTSPTEMEFPPFASLGGVTVETIPSHAGDWKQPQEFVTSCHSNWNILNEILEAISVARKDHKICCTKLKITTKKLEAVDVEVNRCVSEIETSSKSTPPSTVCRVEVDAEKNLIHRGFVQENTRICNEEN